MTTLHHIFMIFSIIFLLVAFFRWPATAIGEATTNTVLKVLFLLMAIVGIFLESKALGLF